MTDKPPAPEILAMPALPLRNLVVFPGMSVPLFVGRTASMGAIDAAREFKNHIFVTAQKNGDLNDPKREDLYDDGCIVEIVQTVRLPDGTLKVIVEGRSRARIESWTEGRDYAAAKVIAVNSEPDLSDSTEIQALMRNIIHRFEEYCRLSNKTPVEAAMSVVNIDDPSTLTDAAVSNLAVPPQVKQSFLAERSVSKRLLALSELLERELEISRMEIRIRERVRKQMETLQREHYLNEQVKAIHKELGKSDEKEELQELRESLDRAGLSDEAKEKAAKELSRLEKMPPMTPETTVSRTYLGWLADLPWNKRTEDSIDVRRAKQILDEDHYGLDKPKERILEYLAVCKLAGKIKGPILCFVGPPGVGKTSLGKSIARALGRQFVRMSLGGVRDEAEIRGHRRTYIGSLPGRILQLLAKAKSKNPVFLLDEVDKMSVDFRGDPSSALLEVLDPEQNSHFVDHYLEVGFDLSECLFITTANLRLSIPYPLLDRMEVIELPGYTEPEKIRIARTFLVPKQIRENGMPPSMMRLGEDALRSIVRRYTNEAGVRDLERHIGKLVRHAARKTAEGRKIRRAISQKQLQKILGVPQVHEKRTLLSNRVDPGTAAGLAWTELGGDVLIVEVVLVTGRGQLILTGRLGEVMKESGLAALTFARTIGEGLGIKPEIFRKHDFHVHVAEGAIPKDGPSAGITIASALLSAVLREPLPAHLAMTGEITLRGRVLPVGGLRSKLLAARRYGITAVILPKENKPQISEIPAHEIQGLKLHYVESIRDALPFLFPARRYRESPASRSSRPGESKSGISVTIPAAH